MRYRDSKARHRSHGGKTRGVFLSKSEMCADLYEKKNGSAVGCKGSIARTLSRKPGVTILWWRGDDGGRGSGGWVMIVEVAVMMEGWGG